MGRRVVLDTSVLIAVLNPRDPHHQAARSQLGARSGDELLVPASAYSEMLVHPYRVSPATAREAERFVHELPARVVPIDGDTARRAAEIRARRSGVTLGDALVLASGDTLDAAEVLTADASWSKLSRRARVI